METTTRNATLADLAQMLQTQHTRKLDVVVPADRINAVEGQLLISGIEPIVDLDGVTNVDGLYQPTAVCDGGISAKLGIPAGYLRTCREHNPLLWDANVNGWLGHERTAGRYLVRCFRAQDGDHGIARAFLSDVYKPIDHLDALLAALDGVRQSGANVQIEACDLTDRRMYVRVVCEEVKALAPVLLDGYRSPLNPDTIRAGGWSLNAARAAAGREGQGYEPGSEPVVFGGFEIRNSETGHGAFSITPRLVIRVCRNGLTFAVDALKAQHLGARLNDGIVRWSDDTLRRNLELITAQARDAVATFLDPRYVASKVAELEKAAATGVTDVDHTIKTVSQKLQFPEELRASILNHFLLGGQANAAGVLNAVTSVAWTVDDADLAATLEARAPEAMALAARIG